MQSIKVADRKYREYLTDYLYKGDGKEPHAREGIEGQQLRGHDDAAGDDEGETAEGEQEEEGEFQQL